MATDDQSPQAPSGPDANPDERAAPATDPAARRETLPLDDGGETAGALPAADAPTVVAATVHREEEIATIHLDARPRGTVAGRAGSLEPGPLRPGDLFLGKYDIERLIGSGGMGSVVLARHRDLDAHYAIKILHSSIPDRSAVDRFKREARTGAMMDHPNIVRVFDCGEHEGRCYIIMEYLRGESLRARLKRLGRIPVDEVVRFAGVICDVLALMHANGIVHRDLKPDNVVYQQRPGAETVKILDFGIAKLASASMSGHLTETGTIVGTPAYMSPEQCEAGEVDGRSDIYSLGVILFQMLTGKLPFESDNLLTMMYLHVNEPPPAAHEWEPGVPPAVSDVVRRMMAKSPADRHQSAWSCAKALSEASGVAIPLPLPPPGAEAPGDGAARTVARAAALPGAAAARRGPARRSLAYLAAGLLVVAAAVAWSLAPGPEPAPEPAAAPAPPLGDSILAERFVAIPGGDVTIGSSPEDCQGMEACEIGPDEVPRHPVSLAPYYLSKFEVTNREYQEFVRATGRAAPRHWRDTYPRGADELPVTNVTWSDAVAYAEWRSARDRIAYRLPSEAEWEHAARGGESRLFPWGDFWNESYVNGNKRRSEGSPLPVNQPPNNTTDVSPLGVFALGGNVSEWTSSQFAAYPGSAYRPTPGDLASKTIRGGSFNLEPNSLRASYRFWQPAGYSSFDLGFRLAADGPSAPTR